MPETSSALVEGQFTANGFCHRPGRADSPQPIQYWILRCRYYEKGMDAHLTSHPMGGGYKGQMDRVLPVSRSHPPGHSDGATYAVGIIINT